MIESGDELVALLKQWTARLPSAVGGALDGTETTTRWGERHGTWFLRVTWSTDGLLRLAELAVTPVGALPIGSATPVHFSVRSAATTDLRFVVTNLYGRQRGLTGLTPDHLAEQLLSAVRAAQTYVEASLSQAYTTGIPGSALRNPQ